MRDVSHVTFYGVSSAGLGFLADVLLVRLLKVGVKTDTVFVSGTLPILIQSLMIAAYQPAVVVYLTKNPAAHIQLTAQLKRWSFALTWASMLAAPLLTFFTAPGLEAFWLGTALNIGMSCTIFPLMMGEHGRALLHVERRFATAAGLLTLANLGAVVSIFSIIWLGVWGFLLSRICRALILWGGVHWQLKNPPENFNKLPLPWQEIFSAGIGYGSIQVPWLVIRGAVSFSGAGMITAIDIAWRLLSQIAYLVVLVPTITKLPALVQTPEHQQIRRLLYITTTLAALSTIGIMFAALPIVIALYGFDHAPLFAQTLLIMSPALIGLSLLRFVQYMHFVRREAPQVNRLAGWTVLLSLLLAWAGAAGIGLALSLGALIGLLQPEYKKSRQHPYS